MPAACSMGATMSGGRVEDLVGRLLLLVGLDAAAAGPRSRLAAHDDHRRRIGRRPRQPARG